MSKSEYWHGRMEGTAIGSTVLALVTHKAADPAAAVPAAAEESMTSISTIIAGRGTHSLTMEAAVGGTVAIAGTAQTQTVEVTAPAVAAVAKTRTRAAGGTTSTR